LWNVDSVIAKIWAQVIARRFALFALAALIGVFALGMANVAGFYGLQPSWGSVGAAALSLIRGLRAKKGGPSHLRPRFAVVHVLGGTAIERTQVMRTPAPLASCR